MYRPARRWRVERVVVGFEADAVDGEAVLAGTHLDLRTVRNARCQIRHSIERDAEHVHVPRHRT